MGIIVLSPMKDTSHLFLKIEEHTAMHGFLYDYMKLQETNINRINSLKIIIVS